MKVYNNQGNPVEVVVPKKESQKTIAEFIDEHIQKGESPRQVADLAIRAGHIDDNMQNWLQVRLMAEKRTGWDVQRIKDFDLIQLQSQHQFLTLSPLATRRLAKALLCAAQEIDGNECVTVCFKTQSGNLNADCLDVLKGGVEDLVDECEFLDGAEVL